MRDYNALTRGMTVDAVEKIIGAISLKYIREDDFQCDCAEFAEDGVSLFFKPETHLLYTIKYYSPYEGCVHGVKLGMTQNEVKSILGAPSRKDPFPWLPDQRAIWLYDSIEAHGSLRLDFDKKRNGKIFEICR